MTLIVTVGNHTRVLVDIECFETPYTKHNFTHQASIRGSDSKYCNIAGVGYTSEEALNTLLEILVQDGISSHI